MFEDNRNERWLIMLLSLTVPDLKKQSKTTDHETKEKNPASAEKLQRQGLSKKLRWCIMNGLVSSVFQLISYLNLTYDTELYKSKQSMMKLNH